MFSQEKSQFYTNSINQKTACSSSSIKIVPLQSAIFVYRMWLFNMIMQSMFKKMVNTLVLWILYITYWRQYKPRMRKKLNHTKMIWNRSSCKISPPSFSSRWNSISDWACTIISCFLTNSGNVKRVTGLCPVEIYQFKANKNSKTK